MSEAPPRGPTVTRAIFIAAGTARGRMHITAEGEGLLARAAPLVARLGEQPVRNIVLKANGSGFAGILEQMPRSGDRLFVGYADTELAQTDVVFPGAETTDPLLA